MHGAWLYHNGYDLVDRSLLAYLKDCAKRIVFKLGIILDFNRDTLAVLVVDDVKRSALFAVDDTVSRAEHRHRRIKFIEAKSFFVSTNIRFGRSHISDVVNVNLHRTGHVVVNLMAVMLLANEGEGIFMSID